jgi:hypothetical protein
VANGITTVHLSYVVCGDEVYGNCTELSPLPNCATAPIPQAPPPVRPDQSPPADQGMIPLTVPEITHLLTNRPARPGPPGHAEHWLDWRRRHQARSRWYHQRTRLTREVARVS